LINGPTLAQVAAPLTGANTGATTAGASSTASGPNTAVSPTTAAGARVNAALGIIVTSLAALPPDEFTQMEVNFSLFFGPAIQMYEATLVSDDSPFDRFQAGDAGALSRSAPRMRR
jgi:cytochrome c peroxidase